MTVVPMPRREIEIADVPDGWSPGQPMADESSEQIVLGMMMASPRQVDAAMEILAGEDFYYPRHPTVWSALLALWADGKPTNPVAVGRMLDETVGVASAGGVEYLHSLLARVPTAAGTVGYYARIVRDWSQRRRVFEAGVRVVQSARTLSLPVDRVVERAQQDIHAATVARNNADPVAVDDFIDDELQYLEDVQAGRVEPGISSGIVDLDRLLGGWQPGRLIIPAGRPAMGKSLLSLGWAVEAAKLGHPSLIFPMEMSKREVMWRILSAWSRVPLHMFQGSQFRPEDWAKLRVARDEVRKLPLEIDDQANTVGQITSNSRRFAQRHERVGMIVADYLQRLNFPGKDRRDMEVGHAAKTFKGLARELNTTFVAVCQLNRGNEGRQHKIPQLSDLRDSGELEQEADQVILIHRDDYYEKESPRAGEADLIVAKNRHGPTDTVTVAAQLHVARFVDMAIL